MKMIINGMQYWKYVHFLVLKYIININHVFIMKYACILLCMVYTHGLFMVKSISVICYCYQCSYRRTVRI